MGTEIRVFGGRLETLCSVIKCCLSKEGKVLDGGVTSVMMSYA